MGSFFLVAAVAWALAPADYLPDDTPFKGIKSFADNPDGSLIFSLAHNLFGSILVGNGLNKFQKT